MASKKVSGKKIAVGVGAGVALAAGIAGAYLLYGKHGAKNRRKVKSWMIKARAEVLEQIEKAQEWNAKTYDEAVKMVAAKYRQIKKLDPKEVEHLVKELSGQWSRISKHLAKEEKRRAKKKPRRKSRR